ncbi:MAG: hypothetical protein CL819_09080 [Croceicoccus sp.]|nr:hypothetical protein [Croceicoccus sp.]
MEGCPYCVRGQVANPEIYPPSAFPRIREITRTVIDIVAEHKDGGRVARTEHEKMLVVCPKCKGSRMLPVVEAAHELLVANDDDA